MVVGGISEEPTNDSLISQDQSWGTHW